MTPATGPSFRLLLLASLASSLLLAAAYFPLSWGWLGWVGWVPFGVLVRAPRVPRLYLAAWLGSLPFYFIVLWWVSVANWFMTGAWIFLALYGSTYVPVLLYVLRTLDQRFGWPFCLSLPVTLVCLEWIRAQLAGGFVTLFLGYQHDFPGGFAWYMLGHTQHDFLELIQMADLFGVYGVTFVVAAVNGLIFDMLARTPGRFRRVDLLVQSLGVAAVLLASLWYGVNQLQTATLQPGPRVALLQGSIPQRIRDQGFFQGGEAVQSQAKHYKQLCDLAMQARPDLIVWPETSNPGLWEEHRPGQPTPEANDFATVLLSRYPAAHLLGMNSVEMDLQGVVRSYNSAIYLQPGQGYVGRYDKVHRVPFGEYIPFGPVLGQLRGLGPNSGDYGIAPGKGFPRFDINKSTYFSVMICYEDSVPEIASEYFRYKFLPDFLVNISNDGWWNGTFGHDQHLAICRFRAVECRRSVVRAVNMGISGIIDSNGRVLSPEVTTQGDKILWTVPDKAEALPVGRWHTFRVQPGVIVGRVPIDTRTSMYPRLGNVGVVICLFGIGFLLLAAWSAKPDERKHAGENPPAA
jgi:apolipoprotein N-acyltransferase